MRFLRLYPPVPEPGRRIVKPNKEEFKLGSRTLPPGTAIVEECLYIHRRKDIWGDDADEFKPECFSNGTMKDIWGDDADEFEPECFSNGTMKDIWGDDADEFKPERSSNGAMNACKHPYGLYHLGIGARNCIGQQVAVIEAKIVIVLILKHFSFRLSPNYRHAPYKTITLATNARLFWSRYADSTLCCGPKVLCNIGICLQTEFVPW